jgi:hypothetical protein
MIFIVLMHVIKAPAAIVDMVGFLGGIAGLALFPIGIIKGIASFSGK